MRNLTRDMVKQRAVHIIKATIFKIRVVILDPKAEVDLHMINDESVCFSNPFDSFLLWLCTQFDVICELLLNILNNTYK